ncbi:MAG: hypothetical protein HYW56_01830 [Candidatus Harrisonbacteria bacterium]|nr:hypothetical protein [Candidatus Harrisonbacteria bacterium]
MFDDYRALSSDLHYYLPIRIIRDYSMLFSQLFSKTTKAFPKDEEAVNAKYLLRGGFIRKMSAGVFTFLPLGFRVLQKVVNIVREEMNAIGAEELLMNALVAKEYWTKTGRWDVDVVYKLKNQAGEEFGLGWTHEEVITAIAQHFIQSYKDLPKAVYQIQTKFRSEPRAKNGLLRGREFMMKDLYSFHADKADLDAYYATVIKAYEKIMKRIGLQYVIAEATGGAFTKEYTHEFQVLGSSGEDTVYYCEKCRYAQNKEVASPDMISSAGKCPKCGGKILSGSAIEVANVFRLGTRYSDAYGVKFLDKDGTSKPVVMGSYGIGPSRIVATVVEVSHDERGIIWPKSIAPFAAHLVLLGDGKKEAAAAKKLYADLMKRGVEVLFDNRDVSAGEKFADADLLGVPLRIVVSAKTVAAKRVEVKERASGKAKLVSVSVFMKTMR